MTNHALDQVLSGIQQAANLTSDEIIRVGGGSQIEEIKNMGLVNKRFSRSYFRQSRARYFSEFRKLRASLRLFHDLLEKIPTFETFCYSSLLTERRKIDGVKEVFLKISEIIHDTRKEGLKTLYSKLDDESAENQEYITILSFKEKQRLNHLKKLIKSSHELEIFVNCSLINFDAGKNFFEHSSKWWKFSEIFINRVEEKEASRDTVDGLFEEESLDPRQMLEELERRMVFDDIEDDSSEFVEFVDVFLNPQKYSPSIELSFLDLDEISSRLSKVTCLRDLQLISLNEKLTICHSLLHVWQRQIIDGYLPIARRYEDLSNQWKYELEFIDSDIISSAKIVALTTTGASQYRRILEYVKPKIIVYEEAAEVLESHVLSSLSSSAEHLILVGDHKQLRPTVSNYDMEKKFLLDVSLFERLISSKIPSCQLKIQRRMRPEIAVLTKRYYEEKIEDHTSVLERSEKLAKQSKVPIMKILAKGMERNMYWFDHNAAENAFGEDDNKSKQNSYEAKYIVNFLMFLLKNGNSPSSITVLSAYMGQVRQIRQELKTISSKYGIDKVDIRSIDRYQGEENQIIILSLVRSQDIAVNHDSRKSNFALRSIGFLSKANRICVALSRAREALYVFGNSVYFSSVCGLWKEVVGEFEKRASIGYSLKITCEKHNKISEISKPEDFVKLSPHGGCNIPCDARLSCGHICPLNCHPYDSEHLNVSCTSNCTRIIQECGHNCLKKCSVKCEPCTTMVERILSCGHNASMYCSTKPDSYKCKVPMTRVFDCGHSREVQCSVLHFATCNETLMKIPPGCKSAIVSILYLWFILMNCALICF